jgi:hypothetical protein
MKKKYEVSCFEGLAVLPGELEVSPDLEVLFMVYRTSGVIFFHRLLHSYTRHIERVDRGERDIVPSTQD